MPKVTYIGTMEALAHHGNPTGTLYVFQRGIPHEVADVDAEHYKAEITRGGPWLVELGIVDEAVDAVKKRVRKDRRQ